MLDNVFIIFVFSGFYAQELTNARFDETNRIIKNILLKCFRPSAGYSRSTVNLKGLEENLLFWGFVEEKSQFVETNVIQRISFFILEAYSGMIIIAHSFMDINRRRQLEEN